MSFSPMYDYPPTLRAQQAEEQREADEREAEREEALGWLRRIMARLERAADFADKAADAYREMTGDRDWGLDADRDALNEAWAVVDQIAWRMSL